MSVLQLSSITKKFGKFSALKDVNLDVNEGEILGFIGPNGAGKSTTIKIILGIIHQTSGDVSIFDKPMKQLTSEDMSRISYIPGDVNVWPNFTGGEMIDFLIRLNGNEIPGRKEALMERFHFDPKKKCKNYSKGNLQKIGIISALSIDAMLYIFDEPTSGLDPLMEHEFQECVLELKHANKCVLLSSHILSEVEHLCDRISIIKDGTVIETGTLNDMRHLTYHLYTVESQDDLTYLKDEAGVHQFERDGSRYTFQVGHQHTQAILQRINQHHIQDIQIAPPSLETLFMKHYQKDSKVE